MFVEFVLVWKQFQLSSRDNIIRSNDFWRNMFVNYIDKG